VEIITPLRHEFLRIKVTELFQRYSVPRWVVFIEDNFVVFASFMLAYLLRYNFVLSDFSMHLALMHAFVTLSIYGTFSLVFRYYSDLLRHTTITDIINIFVATSLSFLALLLISLGARILCEWNFIIVPLSILVIHYMLVTVFLFFVRLFAKTAYYFVTASFLPKKRVLILGAETIGITVKRVLLSDVQGGFQVVGFVDGNRKLIGKKISGIPVYDIKALNLEFIKKHQIQTFVLAMNELPSSAKGHYIQTALQLGLEVLETPAINQWLNGKLQLQQIRKVNLHDLLGREPIRLNLKRINIGLSGKTILVTGAAGSIGSEIVRQLTRFNIEKLILVDQAETPMFHLENEILAKENAFQVRTIIADVTNKNAMERVFTMHKPEVVFHAAAYKHVPLMEANPHEAIRVNVSGTKILTDLALQYAVRKFVMISTDKAVNPTNVMGASKRICEMIVQANAKKAGKNTQFVITRFGNVLGSNGSVIPLFTKQIEEGGPVTVTHPDVTRYFMTIPEACELVLEAGFMGRGGEIYVFDMGDPIKIVDLANQMIRLSGLSVEKDIKIVFTGLRPGEKLYEELLTSEENTIPTHHPKIKIAQYVDFDGSLFIKTIDQFLYNLYRLSKSEIIAHCQRLVPEYSTQFLSLNPIENIILPAQEEITENTHVS
jgi:FlaA1/EpsC-like NDP-sugar epimerase